MKAERGCTIQHLNVARNNKGNLLIKLHKIVAYIDIYVIGIAKYLQMANLDHVYA